MKAAKKRVGEGRLGVGGRSTPIRNLARMDYKDDTHSRRSGEIGWSQELGDGASQAEMYMGGACGQDGIQ